MTFDPVGLSERGLARWRELEHAREWTDAQRQLVAAYCASWGRWADAVAHVAEHGAVVTITDDKGNVKVHGPSPHIKVAEQAMREWRDLADRINV